MPVGNLTDLCLIVKFPRGEALLPLDREELCEWLRGVAFLWRDSISHLFAVRGQDEMDVCRIRIQSDIHWRRLRTHEVRVGPKIVLFAPGDKLIPVSAQSTSNHLRGRREFGTA